MKIEFSAREAHFLDHLAPIWRAIPEQYRGRILVGNQQVEEHGRRTLGLAPVEIGYPRRNETLGPVVVASWGDAHVAQRCRRPVVLLEHGAGQSYGPNRHTSYAGGRGRDGIALFVMPNEISAARNRRFYPMAKTVVVGSARVDELAELPDPDGDPTAALAFHWRCTVTPETNTALDDFAPELERARLELAEAGIRLVGHAHPRIWREAKRLYVDAGIEPVRDFVDVVRRAHVYAVDNSSTLFEFAALDRPVVVLNARGYRRDVDFGLRFWSEADVGLNAEPGELTDTIRRAFDDPDDVARSRRDAVDRVYPVHDGTSAELAAEAIVSLIRGKCSICGVAACRCTSSGPTDVSSIDRRKKDPQRMGLKTYRNPDGSGFLRLNEADARKLGIFGQHVGSTPAAGPPPPTAPPAPLEPVDDPREPTPEVPKGALKPGGPTARARAKAAAEPEPAPDADGEEEPKDKKRPAPGTSGRRRRRAEPSEP